MSIVNIPNVEVHKHLGLYFSSTGSWDYHIKITLDKAWNRIHIMRALKFKLDRYTMQIIYPSFIRPVLEYADNIWDNVPEYMKTEVDKDQNYSARIVTGCTKLVSFKNLANESGWEPLRSRRKKKQRKFVLFFKMVKGITSEYLSFLVPDTVGNTTNYNLLRANDLQCIACRTSKYKKYFIMSVVDDWNALPQEIRNLDSITSLKTYLDRDKAIPNKLYFIGEGEYQIIYTRLRNKCSSRNFDLFQ